MARVPGLSVVVMVACLLGCATENQVESSGQAGLDAYPPRDMERPSQVDAADWVPLGPRAGVAVHPGARSRVTARLFAWVNGAWVPLSLENPPDVLRVTD